MFRQLTCWWFGCDPDYEREYPDYESAREKYCVPCSRCDETDVPYCDMVGDTRHNRVKEWVTSPVRWVVSFLWTPKCPDCGKSGDCGCPPF